MIENKNQSDNSQNNNSQNTNGNNGKNKKPKFNFYWVYGLIIVVFLAFNFMNWDSGAEETNWGNLKQMLRNQDVEKIVLVNKDFAEIYLKPDALNKKEYDDAAEDSFGGKTPHYIYTIGSVDKFYERVEEAQKDIENPVFINNEKRRNWGGEILSWVLPLLLLVGVWIFFMRMMSRGGAGGGGQLFNIGKSKAQIFDKENSVDVNFQDVAGLDEAKVEIKEIVEFLSKPERYTNLGGKIPKGALLVGPPGTGKTLLARAVAGEAGVPFFSISGSDFVEMFVGVGASRVRDLFKQAKEKAPCIIFIDEIDAIGRSRGRNAMSGSNDERENTLNQLLNEMDGFAANTGVIILAATNRADVLDKALLRAGRFDRQIPVELPDLKERKEIFSVHMKPLKLNSEVDNEFMAKQTPGFSGADIANACNEAALIAARKSHSSITKKDFMDAVDRIIGGLEKRNKIISAGEKKTIAYHESGHAAVSWLLEHASPLVKVTIVPRGKSLGAAWYLPEERQITTYEQMVDEMTAALAGRASEEVNFGTISTGALNDLERVTKQAYAMVAYFGLNKRLGNISYYDSTGQQEYSLQKPYSEKTAEEIDEEVHKLVEESYERAKQLLSDNKDKVEKLASMLLEREVIFTDDLEKIFGKRKDDEDKIPRLQDFHEDQEEEKQKEEKAEADDEEITTGAKKESDEEQNTGAAENTTSSGDDGRDEDSNKQKKKTVKEEPNQNLTPKKEDGDDSEETGS
ncbi:MAG: ATP-dependent zinc metalloprotease FtsH [Bacteroidales bacterium]|nr:ATP-dependent zinc metalloprotease FtsH [Bacteroidales bacterium]MCF8332630.1 ATP-dependent zinc metalloprotease FtsH [Bacteroidales bacterium]